jgi:hypothetical protein
MIMKNVFGHFLPLLKASRLCSLFFFIYAKTEQASASAAEPFVVFKFFDAQHPHSRLCSQIQLPGETERISG